MGVYHSMGANLIVDDVIDVDHDHLMEEENHAHSCYKLGQRCLCERNEKEWTANHSHYYSNCEEMVTYYVDDARCDLQTWNLVGEQALDEALQFRARCAGEDVAVLEQSLEISETCTQSLC